MIEYSFWSNSEGKSLWFIMVLSNKKICFYARRNITSSEYEYLITGLESVNAK